MKSANATRPERGPHDRQYRKVYGAWRQFPLKLVVLGNRLVEKWMHYDIILGRNMPCVEDVPCEYCLRHQRRVYKAYLAAYRRDTNEVCVAELTEHALSEFEKKEGLPSDWRGWMFTLKREKRHANAPVFVFDISKHPKPANLPASFDVEEQLHRLWGWIRNNPQDAVESREVVEQMRHEANLHNIEGLEPPY